MPCAAPERDHRRLRHSQFPDYHEAIARAGAFVQVGAFRHPTGPSFERRVRFICELEDNGFADRILASHDMCETTRLRFKSRGGLAVVPIAFRARLEQ
ncbi:phosphotriesterase family protein [Ornithinicoccus halotolerans]|uniref:phosphotriesterase family protein n=1 Tax=Ornithinicoccus halotolerans TaxID=1748220 RepID=UPI001294BD5C